MPPISSTFPLAKENSCSEADCKLLDSEVPRSSDLENGNLDFALCSMCLQWAIPMESKWPEAASHESDCLNSFGPCGSTLA